MHIKVLGCYGGELPGKKTSCLMINHRLVIDAGALTGSISLEEQADIDYILLSHAHLDHVLDVGFLADNVFGKRDKPVQIVSTKTILAQLKKHVLNNRIWPDFTVIPNPRDPILKLKPIKTNEWFKLGKLKIMAVPVNHAVSAVGYIVEENGRSMVYSGDTGPTTRLWKEVNKLKDLKAVFIETSFPDSVQDVADVSGHLTPRTLIGELAKVNQNGMDVYIYHLKPAYLETLTKEIRAKKIPKSHLLKLDQEIEI